MYRLFNLGVWIEFWLFGPNKHPWLMGLLIMILAILTSGLFYLLFTS